MKINFFGDIFPANLHYNVGFGVASIIEKLSPLYVVNSIKEFTHDGDLNIANLESPLLPLSSEPGKNSFIAPDSFARILREANIQVVNIANNHIMEQGDYGLNNTIQVLNNANISVVGINDNDYNPIIKEINTNELKICLVGFNSIDHFIIGEKVSELTINNVLKSLEIMSEMGANLKIVSIHWGDEFISRPSPNQIEIAKLIIDNGADIIFGHHPHVVQPVQIYKNKIIMYSLGNFIFDLFWDKKARFGFVFQVEFENKSFIGFRLKPFFIKNDYFPVKIDTRAYDDFIIYNDPYIDNYEYTLKKIKIINKIKMRLYLLRNINKIGINGIKRILNNRRHRRKINSEFIK